MTLCSDTANNKANNNYKQFKAAMNVKLLIIMKTSLIDGSMNFHFSYSYTHSVCIIKTECVSKRNEVNYGRHLPTRAVYASSLQHRSFCLSARINLKIALNRTMITAGHKEGGGRGREGK